MISKQQGIDALREAGHRLNEGRKSRFRSALAIIAIGLAASLVIQYFQLHRQSADLDGDLSSTAATLTGVAFLANLLLIFAGRPLAFVGVANVGMLLFALKFIGIANPWVDSVIFLLAIVVGVAISKWKRLAPKPGTPGTKDLVIHTWNLVRWPVAVSAAFWIVLSVGVGVSDWIRDILTDAPKQERLSARAIDPRYADTTQLRVGVALSGGGYRAALMHAGVLHMIDSLGIPVRAMSTVSGGSIVGAHYVLGGSPAQFLEAALDKRLSLARRIFRPWTFAKLVAYTRYGTSDYFILPFGDYNRTHVQAQLLDEVFYRQAKHRHETDADGNRIELMLCMTDIVNSAMIGVTPHGYLEQVVNPPTARFNFMARPLPIELGDFRRNDPTALPGERNLAMLVAASGAFPGAFKPLRVSVVNASGSRTDTVRMVLADGGMADNLGLVLLYTARHLVRNRTVTQAMHISDEAVQAVNRWDVNFVIASDGSALSAPVIPASGIEEMGSSINLVSRASAGERLAGEYENPPTVLLSPDQFLGRSRGQLTARLPFGWDTGSDTIRVDPRSFPTQEPTFLSLEPRDLEFLVSTMDSTTVSRDSLAKAIREIIARNGREGTNSLARWEKRSWADTTVWSAVRADLEDVLTVFLETSTLDGDFDHHDAKALYRLGQYLFLLNRPLLVYSAEYAKRRVDTPNVMMMQAGAPRSAVSVKPRVMVTPDSQRVRPRRYRK
jgi:predicted acylesterase/phospholipase RssA